jgi:hypothetical protein
MVKAAKAHTKRAIAISYNQRELNFQSARSSKHPIFPYGDFTINQPFFPKLQKQEIATRIIGNNEEVTEFILETINKGLVLLRALILKSDTQLLELKSVTAIITTYLPENSRDQNPLKCYPLWNSFSRNLSRSIRRTSMYRLSMAAQEMGNELPQLSAQCDALIRKIYRLINGDTGKIKDNSDRNVWEQSLESKPQKYIKIGTLFVTKL